MKEMIGRFRNKCWIAVLVLVFGFLCCGNMKVYAATCVYEHTYGDLDFMWAPNYADAFVYVKCKNCMQRYDYVGIADVRVVSSQEATCTAPGIVEYMASIEYNGQEYYCSEFEMTSEALGHDFGEWKYEWAEDYKSCTATRKCKRDSSHMETYMLRTSSMAYVRTKEPTCTGKGTTRIYALFEDWTRDMETGGYIVPNTYVDVENIEIDPTAHTGEIILKDKKASNCTEDGYTGDRVYSCCGAVVESGTVLQARGHSYDSGTITKPATCSDQGVKTYTCSVCNDTKTEDIAVDKTKHTGGTQTKNVVVASCGSTGYTGDVVCIGCGDILKAGNVVDKTQNHKASALAKENIKDADCIHDGSYDNVSYCEVCHKEMSRTKVETKALGHKWVSAGTVKTTANNPGTESQSYVCSVCGATKTESVDGTHTHVYEKSVIPATKNSDGKIEWKCGECQDVKSSEIISRIKSVELSSSSFTYNGKHKKPTVTIKDNAGNTVSSDCYTVSYKNNKAVGKATVIITMKGNYSGAYTKTFNITPAKTTVSKLTTISKGFKITWKKQTSQITGYQIQYSTSKNFKNAKQKLIANNKTTSCSIKKLTAGKKYYVRIRTYKIVDGKKIYSGWSAAKTITTGK